MSGKQSTSTVHSWFRAVSNIPGQYDRLPRMFPGDAATLLIGDDLHISARGPQYSISYGELDSFRLLSPVPRLHERELTIEETRSLLERESDDDFAGILPPFAAVQWNENAGLAAVVDPLGLRHLYHRRTSWTAGIATCPLSLVHGVPYELDRVALGAQSLLGWQLADRSPIEGVRVVPPGSIVQLHHGRLTSRTTSHGPAAGPFCDEPDTLELNEEPRPLDLDTAVRQGAMLLQHWMGAFLDHHPDAILQLSGGIDSRLLLSAVPPARRRQLTALTLGRPGEHDMDIATHLSAHCGMDQLIINYDGLEELSPYQAHALVQASARALNCSADPICHAANSWAESLGDGRPRLAGVGGEAGKGRYYLGRPRSVPVTRGRVERLAAWKLFANHSVPAECLEPDFHKSARETTLRDLQDLLSSYGPDWARATDMLCLRQLERRWAGILATSTCYERRTINPLFDDRFLALTQRLRPRDLHQGRFFARLIAALDEDLARIPMDNRPSPLAYTSATPLNRARVTSSYSRAASRKILQRARGHRLPPMGGPVLVNLLAEHYQESPRPLEKIAQLQIFRSNWLEALAQGRTQLPAAAAGMLVNLQTLMDA